MLPSVSPRWMHVPADVPGCHALDPRINSTIQLWLKQHKWLPPRELPAELYVQTRYGVQYYSHLSLYTGPLCPQGGQTRKRVGQ